MARRVSKPASKRKKEVIFLDVRVNHADREYPTKEAK